MIYFKQQCELIALAIKDKIYPVTYYGSAWPADVVLCVASLSLHDKIFSPQYSVIISKWVDRVKSKLDRNGLIPHLADPLNGVAIQNARGSSQSLMLIFLKEIDKDFSEQQFKIYKDNFLDVRLGLTGIREYMKGDYGIGDVDSGPVILQMGSAATIVGMQTLYLYNDCEASSTIKSGVDALAFPMTTGDKKIYVFGLVPIADAFIVWGHSVMNVSQNNKTSFVAFHGYSAIVAIVIIILMWFLWKSKRRSSEESLHIPW